MIREADIDGDGEIGTNTHTPWTVFQTFHLSFLTSDTFIECTDYEEFVEMLT